MKVGGNGGRGPQSDECRKGNDFLKLVTWPACPRSEEGNVRNCLKTGQKLPRKGYF